MNMKTSMYLRVAILAMAAMAAMAAMGMAHAKLPAPSDEAKAAAAVAADKAGWANKVAGYLLCQSQDRVAAHHLAKARAAGKPVAAPVATAACADPGPYVPADPAKKS
jgi:hypothetical protein